MRIDALVYDHLAKIICSMQAEMSFFFRKRPPRKVSGKWYIIIDFSFPWRIKASKCLNELTLYKE